MAAPQFILALHLGKTVAAKKRCRVLYSYQPKHEDELELKVDDVVDFESEVEDGWWKGKLVSYLNKDCLSKSPTSTVSLKRANLDLFIFIFVLSKRHILQINFN